MSNSPKIKAEEVGLTEDELKNIKDNFTTNFSRYEQAAQSITGILLKTPGVHSATYRIKDPSHLIEKIIRKRSENKQRIINESNYEDEITDLAGVRVLHLFKEDWQRIHGFIRKNWDLEEEPTAYYRKGDSNDILNTFTSCGCVIREHTSGYRSVHYLIKTNLTVNKVIVEVQVRTIFEEGWSEVDHKIRYPSFSNEPLTNNLLMILNRLAGSADEMSGFVQDVHAYITKSKKDEEERNQHIKSLEEIVRKSNISKDEKSNFENVAKAITKPTSLSANSYPTIINYREEYTKDIYTPLSNFLKYEISDNVNNFLTDIDTIEKLIKHPLPEAASKQISWWTDYSTHARQWLLSGWSVNKIDENTRQVSFYRWSHYINDKNDAEVDKWAKEFNITKGSLLKLISTIGSLSTVIFDYLKSNQH